jgi:hypothetical protein
MFRTNVDRMVRRPPPRSKAPIALAAQTASIIKVLY